MGNTDNTVFTDVGQTTTTCHTILEPLSKVVKVIYVIGDDKLGLK